jgi:hypothetical protein
LSDRHAPDLSLAGVLDQAGTVLDHEDNPTGSGGRAAGGVRECVPVHLTDGRTWFCINEGDRQTPVLTRTAGGPRFKPVGKLVAGDRIVVPAGDATDSVHARLLALSRSNRDVATLDALLTQFRRAARTVLDNANTKKDAIDAVVAAGAEARELDAWADGTTIAPRVPGDVAAVFRAAGQRPPNLGLVYAVAGELRSLSAVLRSFSTAIAAGRGDAVADKLRRLIGPAADEILDEYVEAVVDSVDANVTVGASHAGRLR